MGFPFDVVAFDLDGTLADTAPDLTAALNHALAHLGRRAIPAAEVRHMVGHGARALLRQGLACQGVDDEAAVDRGLPVLLGYYADHIADGSQPYPGVVAALDELAARGVRLAVCTNKAEALARRFLDAVGWSGRFAAVVGGDTVGVAKPDPTPLRAAVAGAGGGRAVLIGDSISDTAAAIAAGLPCVAVTFGFSDRPPAELGATFLIDHFDALIPALERLGER